MWSIIAGKMKLRNLHLGLRLDLRDKKEDEVLARRFLMPLKDVRCSAEFVVRLEPQRLEGFLEDGGSYVIKELINLEKNPYDTDWS